MNTPPRAPVWSARGRAVAWGRKKGKISKTASCKNAALKSAERKSAMLKSAILKTQRAKTPRWRRFKISFPPLRGGPRPAGVFRAASCGGFCRAQHVKTRQGAEFSPSACAPARGARPLRPAWGSERMRCALGRPYGAARKIQNDAIALFKTSFAAFKGTAIALPPLSPLVPPPPPLHPPQSITVGVRPMPTTAEVILRQLLHPQMPSAVRPTARWKALSAFSVFAPKMPSSVRVE